MNTQERWTCPRCGFEVESSSAANLQMAIDWHNRLAVHDDEIPRS